MHSTDKPSQTEADARNPPGLRGEQLDEALVVRAGHDELLPGDPAVLQYSSQDRLHTAHPQSPRSGRGGAVQLANTSVQSRICM